MDSRIDVLAIGDPGAPPTGSPDPEILVWLEQQGYLLVTENRSTIPLHLSNHFAAGRHVPGILWIHPDMGLGRIIEELYMVWSASSADEYQDHTLFLPL